MANTSTSPSVVTPLDVWREIRAEAQQASADEPVLASFYHAAILNHVSFPAAISFHLANKLDSQALPAMMLREVFEQAMRADAAIEIAMRADICAHRERDPACNKYCMPFLFFKGYHALQSWRIAHWLWQQGRNPLALYFQNQISQAFDVDIHVLIGVGAKILGNIEIGEGAKIGAGSVVLDAVASHTTVAGVPAKPVGRPKGDSPALDMDHHLSDDGDG
jgi:serine O-acetyltransferase